MQIKFYLMKKIILKKTAVFSIFKASYIVHENNSVCQRNIVSSPLTVIYEFENIPKFHK